MPPAAPTPDLDDLRREHGTEGPSFTFKGHEYTFPSQAPMAFVLFIQTGTAREAAGGGVTDEEILETFEIVFGTEQWKRALKAGISMEDLEIVMEHVLRPAWKPAAAPEEDADTDSFPNDDPAA